jgi:hypothetical protein
MGTATLMVESKTFDQTDPLDAAFQQVKQGAAPVDPAAQHEHFVVSIAQRSLLLAACVPVQLTYLSTEPSLTSTDPGTQ